MVLIKRTLLSVLLFFISCSTPCLKWSEQKISAPCVNSSRKIFPSSSTYDGFQLEITDYPDGKSLFANLQLATLTCTQTDAFLETASEKYEGIGIVFAGGQRIELPPEWIEIIENEMGNGQNITISFLKFHSTVTSENWEG